MNDLRFTLVMVGMMVTFQLWVISIHLRKIAESLQKNSAAKEKGETNAE